MPDAALVIVAPRNRNGHWGGVETNADVEANMIVSDHMTIITSAEGFLPRDFAAAALIVTIGGQ